MSDDDCSIIRPRRGPSYETSEIFSLLQDVLLHKDILMSPKITSVYNEKKKQIWTNIANKLSLVSSNKRTPLQVKRKWSDLSLLGMAALRKKKRTGQFGRGPSYMPLVIAILNATRIKRLQKYGCLGEQEDNILKGISDEDLDYDDMESTAEDADDDQQAVISHDVADEGETLNCSKSLPPVDGVKARESEQMDFTVRVTTDPSAINMKGNSSQPLPPTGDVAAGGPEEIHYTVAVTPNPSTTEVKCEIEIPPDISALLDAGFQLEQIVDDKPEQAQPQEPSTLTTALQQLSQTLITQAELSQPSPHISLSAVVDPKLHEELVADKALQEVQSEEPSRFTAALQKLSETIVTQAAQSDLSKSAPASGKQRQKSPNQVVMQQPSPASSQALGREKQRQQNPPQASVPTASSSASQQSPDLTKASHMQRLQPHQAAYESTQSVQSTGHSTKQVPTQTRGGRHTQSYESLFSGVPSYMLPLPMQVMRMKMLRNRVRQTSQAKNEEQRETLSEDNALDKWLQLEIELSRERTESLERELELFKLKKKCLELELKALDEKKEHLEMEMTIVKK